MTDTMTTPYLAQYNMGRDAHKHGYTIEQCPFTRLCTKSAFWRGGWHDADMEAGNRIYFDRGMT